MEVSELTVMVLIYSGIMIFFLVPFKRHQNQPIKRPITFKESLQHITFHKKALLTLLLSSFLLVAIWFGYDQEVYHFNAHSGYPPISSNSKAIFYMCALLGYTVILYVALALWISLNNLRRRVD
ncbi:peptide ABC transporter permease [Lysinibacillus sp. CTST325]